MQRTEEEVYRLRRPCAFAAVPYGFLVSLFGVFGGPLAVAATFQALNRLSVQVGVVAATVDRFTAARWAKAQQTALLLGEHAILSVRVSSCGATSNVP
jgi:hypothetical protein